MYKLSVLFFVLMFFYIRWKWKTSSYIWCGLVFCLGGNQ